MYKCLWCYCLLRRWGESCDVGFCFIIRNNAAQLVGELSEESVKWNVSTTVGVCRRYWGESQGDPGSQWATASDLICLSVLLPACLWRIDLGVGIYFTSKPHPGLFALPLQSPLLSLALLCPFSSLALFLTFSFFFPLDPSFSFWGQVSCCLGLAYGL